MTVQSALEAQESMLKSNEPPKCDSKYLFLNAVSSAISNSMFSRIAIIDRMNEALGGEKVVTTDRFSKWMSASSDRLMPMEYLSALCWALQSTEVLDALISPIEFKTVDQRGQTLVLAAQYQLEAKELNKKAEAMLSSVSQSI